MAATKRLAIGAGAALAIAGGLIQHWEGVRYTPYRDLGGVLTVCYGSTKGVERRSYTSDECAQKLQAELKDHLAGLSQCIRRPLRQNEWVALASWAYNVGVGAACRSTLVRKINAGSPPAVWCDELLKWDWSGGKRVPGLTNRRKAEREVCLGN